MKEKKGGLGALCYLAVLAVALLALPGLLLFDHRCAGDEVLLPVVMYHRVGENAADEYTVSPRQLEYDLEALLAAGYRPVRLSEVLAYALEGGSLPHKPVLLVFDDADVSFARGAMPVLKQYGVPAVVSVIGDGAAGVQGEAGEYLTWRQLAALEDTGFVELQSHSASLHTYARPGVRRLAGESRADHAALLAADAAKMQAMATEAGAALLPAFAYPYGALDADAEQALRAAGMLATMTSEEHLNRLTRSPECLFLLGRFERSGRMTTAQLLEKLK
ncbi:polysaccharide deacetylase family protein [Candidatus Allofournierella merdipullorum]|uniref:polysaccharide deacetylase family protein n=1 Tax=Candidatus Allofournierella merdipullorum TaxID=2838595 RepID=UPI00374F8569